MSTLQSEVQLSVRVFGNVDVAVPDGLRVLRDGQKPADEEFLFTILTPRDGDKRLVWNRMNLAEVNDARQMFGDLVAQGMTPHLVGRDGRPMAEVLNSFNPIAEEVSFLDAAEEARSFPGSRISRRVSGGESLQLRNQIPAEVVFLPRKQIVGG